MTLLVTIKTASGAPFSSYPREVEVNTDRLWDALSTAFFSLKDNKLNPGDTVTMTVMGDTVSRSGAVPKQDITVQK